MTPSEFVGELCAIRSEIDILNADSAAYCSELVIVHRMPNDENAHIGGVFHEDFCGVAFVTHRECLTAYNACNRACLLGDCEKCISNMLTRNNTPFAKIEAVEHSDDTTGPRWTFDTDLPCEELPVMDGDKLYCMAIVFRSSDLPGRAVR